MPTPIDNPTVTQNVSEPLIKLAYSVKETAEILNVHPQTVRNLQYRGELKAVRFGRAVRFTREAILEYVALAGGNR